MQNNPGFMPLNVAEKLTWLSKKLHQLLFNRFKFLLTSISTWLCSGHTLQSPITQKVRNISARMPRVFEETVGALLIILNSYLESLICGIKQQFNPILSQVQYEVMAEWCLQRQGVKTDKLTLRGRSRRCHAQANGPWIHLNLRNNHLDLFLTWF